MGGRRMKVTNCERCGVEVEVKNGRMDGGEVWIYTEHYMPPDKNGKSPPCGFGGWPIAVEKRVWDKGEDKEKSNREICPFCTQRVEVVLDLTIPNGHRVLVEHHSWTLPGVGPVKCYGSGKKVIEVMKLKDDYYSTPEKGKVKREATNERYDAINPEFLRCLALIGGHAEEKYGSWEQYFNARLKGDKGPVNHIKKHLMEFETGKAYDKFDGGLDWHLVAIAYNAMMEFNYIQEGWEPDTWEGRLPKANEPVEPELIPQEGETIALIVGNYYSITPPGKTYRVVAYYNGENFYTTSGFAHSIKDVSVHKVITV